jgi:hypothetical protein
MITKTFGTETGLKVFVIMGQAGLAVDAAPEGAGDVFQGGG